MYPARARALILGEAPEAVHVRAGRDGSFLAEARSAGVSLIPADRSLVVLGRGEWVTGEWRYGSIAEGRTENRLMATGIAEKFTRWDDQGRPLEQGRPEADGGETITFAREWA